MTAIDTPDYQRGVTSAQVLLAAVTNYDAYVTVGVPPNAESLVVVIGNGSGTSDCHAVGVTTGAKYPGFPVVADLGDGGSPVWYIDVSSVVDSEVTVYLNGLDTPDWYVYADAASHVSFNPGVATDGDGVTLATIIAPTDAAYTSQINEITTYSVALSASGVAFASPGPASRYRIFAVQMLSPSGGGSGNMYDTTSAKVILACTANASAELTIPLTGFACSNNGSISYYANSAGSMAMLIYATTETG